MKTVLSLSIVAASIGLFYAATALADDGDWKRGRVYYSQVCTTCHLSTSGNAISPADRVKADWKVYLAADKHNVNGNGNGNKSVKYYVSREYRQSIADGNKAAKKFIDVPDAALHADILAFMIYGAKDSDNPSRCQ